MSLHVAASAVRLGLRVLLIDLDPEAVLSTLVFRRAGKDPTIADAIRDPTALDSTITQLRIQLVDDLGRIQRTRVLAIVRAAPHDLETVGRERPAEWTETALRALLLRASRRFDVIIFDAPSPRDPVAGAALRAATRIVVPLRPSFHSEAEIGTYLGELRSNCGVAPSKLLFALLGTDRATGFAECLERLQVLFEPPADTVVKGSNQGKVTKATPSQGKLLVNSIRHEVATFAPLGLEFSPRADWDPLTLEALLEVYGRPLHRSWWRRLLRLGP